MFQLIIACDPKLCFVLILIRCHAQLLDSSLLNSIRSSRPPALLLPTAQLPDDRTPRNG
jgi:hypothetical protein